MSIREVADLVAEVYLKRYGRPLKIEYAADLLPPDITIDFTFNIDRFKALGYSPKADMHEEVDRIFQLLEA
jgi:nucleoside-diphosphate-sugar epimerase